MLDKENLTPTSHENLVPINDVDVFEIAKQTGGAFDILWQHTDNETQVIFYRDSYTSIRFNRNNPLLKTYLLEMGNESHKIDLPLENSVVIIERGKGEGNGRVTFILPINRHTGIPTENTDSDHTTWVTISKVDGITIHTKPNWWGVDPEILNAALYAEKLKIDSASSQSL